MGFRLHILSAPRLTGPSGTVTLERKTAAVLAYLALEGPVSKYKLAGWLWPESGETTARNNMRQLLRRLRLSGGEVVLGEDRIELHPEVEVDLKKFSYLETPSLELLEQDQELLEGLDYDDLPDFAEWVQSTREEFRELRARAAEGEASRLERAGNFKAALEYAQIRLHVEPLSEEGYRQVARLQYLLGDRGSALATLGRCRTLLAQELGTQPLPETLKLLRMIEAGTAMPDAPAKLQRSVIPAAVLRPPVLAGREREWAAMEAAWEAGKLIFVKGEPGVGKTRLVSDFLASKGGYVRLEARPGDVGVPYSSNFRHLRAILAKYPGEPLPAWVRQTLAPWMPELGDADATPDLSPLHQVRFLEAHREIFDLLARHHDALLLDDLQFQDEASNQVGTYLMNSVFPLGGVGLRGYVGCYRSGDNSEAMDHFALQFVETGQAVLIELQPLELESVLTLLKGLEIPTPEHLAAGLSRYTGGNPMFVLETLKHLIETDTLEQGLPVRLAPPGKVAALIGRRLARLSPAALNLARVAAVAGSEFELKLAGAVLEHPAMELAEAHAELEAAQILRGNAFVHDLVFEAVLAGTPLAVKQLLHARVARWLEGPKNASPARIAQHYLEAGDEPSAAGFLVRASRQAMNGSLPAEARDFCERAIAIYRRHSDPREYEAVAELFEVLGVSGSFEEMRATSARLVQLARNPKEKTRALANWAVWLYMTRRFADALAKVDEALASVQPDDPWSGATLHQTALICCIRLGRFALAWEHLAAYKRLAGKMGELGDPQALEAQGAAIEDEGVLLAALDRHTEAVRQFDTALAMIDHHDQFHYAKARILSRRAHSMLVLGQAEVVLADIAQAKEIAARVAVSDRGLVWPCAAEARTFLALGRLPEAWAAAQEAERFDLAEPPKVTYLVLAQVLYALGQCQRAQAELRDFLAQHDTHLSSNVTAQILLAQVTGNPQPLGEAEALLGQIPKPKLQAQLRLMKARFAAPEVALSLCEEALGLVGPLGLKLVEAAALTYKARTLLKLGRLEEAKAAIEEALRYPLSLLSPAEVRFAAFQILEALGNTGAKAQLEAAQDWIHQTALGLPKDLRADFLNQPLHRQIL